MTDAKIKVLGDIEHVRLRPEMYIGSTYDCYHLMQEALDNALDELVNNYAKTVWLDHDNQGHYIIADDGRGIPVHDVNMPDGSIVDSVVASCVKLHSGAKFDTAAYATSIGLHGVGLVCINALSKYMNVSIKKGDVIHHYVFVDSEFVKKETYDNRELNVSWSTRIEFQVDSSYFTKLDIQSKRLVERLSLIVSLYPNKKIIYNDQAIPSIDILDFIKNLLYIDEDTVLFPLTYVDGHDVIKVFFTYDRTSSSSSTIKSDVNLNICEGPFHSTFLTLLINCVNEVYNKDEKLTKSDIQGFLRCYISLNIQSPKFDGQTKGRMVKNVTPLIGNLRESLTRVLKQPFFKEHFEAILESKSFKQAAKVLKKKKSRVSSENPLVDCIKIPGQTLYILEGDSAGGTLKQINNKYTEAIFPLSGKILNTIDISPDRAVDSKKIKYLLEAIGVDLSQKNQESFRYDKVKILCDADSVAGDTLITFIDHEGFIKCKEIQDITIDEIDKVASFNYDTNDVELRKVLRVISHDYDKKEIYRINLSNFSHIDCTDDHCIYVFDTITGVLEELSPTQLDIKKHKALSSTFFPVANKPVFINFAREIYDVCLELTYDLCYLLGYYIGGNVDDFSTISNYKSFDIDHADFKYVLSELNISHGNIPDGLLSLPEESRLGLLTGIFQSCGELIDISENYNLQCIVKTKQLAISVNILLKQFGVKAVIIPSENLDNFTISVIRSSELRKLIPVLETFDNYIALPEQDSSSVLKTHPNIQYLNITSIEKIDYDDKVYDLEVEHNHNFTTGIDGVILHNSDGAHISMLVTIALWKYAPNLIRNNQAVLILPPLYGAMKGSEFIPIYNQSEVDQYLNSGYNVSRFKGLGEMNPSQLKVIVYDQPVEYNIKPPANDKEASNLYECVNNTELKRKLCEDTFNFNITKLF